MRDKVFSKKQPCRVKMPKDVYLPELRKAIAEEKRIIDGVRLPL